MAMTNPVGRVNYEPNSWPATTAGPREDPAGGFTHVPADRGRARKQRVRSETLRRPLQPGPPVPRSARRRSSSSTSSTRSCSSCRKVRAAGASAPGWWPTCATSTTTSPRAIADGLGLAELPAGADAGPRADHRPAAVAGAEHRRTTARRRFAGRKIGVLVTDGTDAARPRRAAQGGRPPRARCVELIAPKIGGVTLERRHARAGRPEGRRRPVGALRRRGRPRLGRRRGRCWPPTPAAKDFVTDAHAHCKFIGYHRRRRRPARRGRRRRSGRRRLRRARQPAGRRRPFIERCRDAALLGSGGERRPDLTPRRAGDDQHVEPTTQRRVWASIGKRPSRDSGSKSGAIAVPGGNTTSVTTSSWCRCRYHATVWCWNGPVYTGTAVLHALLAAGRGDDRRHGAVDQRLVLDGEGVLFQARRGRPARTAPPARRPRPRRPRRERGRASARRARPGGRSRSRPARTRATPAGRRSAGCRRSRPASSAATATIRHGRGPRHRQDEAVAGAGSRRPRRSARRRRRGT